MKGMTRTCTTATIRAKKIHKRVKIGDGAIIPKEKKGIQSADTLESTNSKHGHCMVAERKNCDKASASVSRTRFASITLVSTNTMSFVP